MSFVFFLSLSLSLPFGWKNTYCSPLSFSPFYKTAGKAVKESVLDLTPELVPVWKKVGREKGVCNTSGIKYLLWEPAPPAVPTEASNAT